jgi:hypothetical protein
LLAGGIYRSAGGLSHHARIYKIAILQNIEDYLVGEMLDQQNGVNFADFFMSAFLGCRLADDAEVRTKQFTDSSLGEDKQCRQP